MNISVSYFQMFIFFKETELLFAPISESGPIAMVSFTLEKCYKTTDTWQIFSCQDIKLMITNIMLQEIKTTGAS